MNENGRISFIVFLSVIVLIFTAIILCALEKVSLSSTIGMIACGVCLPGFYYAFQSWNGDDEPDAGQTVPAAAPVSEHFEQDELSAHSAAGRD